MRRQYMVFAMGRMVCFAGEQTWEASCRRTPALALHRANSNENPMQKDDWPKIPLEKIDAGSDHGTAYVVLLVAVVGGLAMFCIGFPTGMRWLGMVPVIGACLGYAYLLRSASTIRYFRYFWLDPYGVHHIEGNTPSDRTAHFAWRDIENAEASTGADEVAGVRLTLNRPGMRSVPVVLALETMTDAERAAAAINDIVRPTSGPGNTRPGERVSWWLDWSALPEQRAWARLTVTRSGTATVLDCDGSTQRFASEEEARMMLLEDEYSRLETLLDEFDLAGVTPPSAPTEAALIAKMKKELRGWETSR